MLTELRDIEEVPKQTASKVKNQWSDVVRLVDEEGQRRSRQSLECEAGLDRCAHL